MDDLVAAEFHALSKRLDDPPVTTTARPDGWHITELRGPYADFIEHFEGVPWDARRAPHRWHRCRAVTRSCRALQVVERCACGALRRRPEDRRWLGRNERHR